MVDPNKENVDYRYLQSRTSFCQIVRREADSRERQKLAQTAMS
jgi:hypothetical protein